MTTIDVSTLDSQVIYIGTDDGNVWVTRDGGDNYDNISEGLPERWITAVAHDPLDEAGVYATVSGFRFGESQSQVFYSDNFGETWRDIGQNLPDVPVNDIIADDLLFGKIYIATDIGVFVGENRGDWWALLGADLPVSPVIDLDFDSASRKLAAATYGRGMFSFVLPNETSSVEDERLVQNTIHPNPAAITLDVTEFTRDSKSVSIYNLQGQLILKSSDRIIDIQELVPSTYIVQRDDGAALRFQKL